MWFALLLSLATAAPVCEARHYSVGWTEIRCPTLEITVRALALVPEGTDVPGALARAAAEKAAEDERLYGGLVREAGYTSLREYAVARGYYGSPVHLGWAMAAEARTGGAAPALWWMEVDPFGGSAGNGPKVIAGGWWPAPAARVAMAHDTDWTLGRYFGVGPMAALRGDVDNPLERLGQVGLFPVPDPRYDGVPSYLGGHPDWIVRRGR